MPILLIYQCQFKNKFTSLFTRQRILIDQRLIRIGNIKNIFNCLREFEWSEILFQRLTDFNFACPIIVFLDCITIIPNCMSLRTNSTNPSQIAKKTVDFRLKYKTEKCRYWFETGYCPFGTLCAFAHDEHEIRNKRELNNHYKTKLCHNFVNHGFCKYGDRCQFVHEIIKKTQSNACETRSNSLQSSSRSSTSQQSKNQQKVTKKCQNKKEKKHSIQLQMLSDFGMNAFDVIFPASQESILSKILEQLKEDIFINCPNASESSNACLAKRRLYSL